MRGRLLKSDGPELRSFFLGGSRVRAPKGPPPPRAPFNNSAHPPPLDPPRPLKGWAKFPPGLRLIKKFLWRQFIETKNSLWRLYNVITTGGGGGGANDPGNNQHSLNTPIIGRR